MFQSTRPHGARHHTLRIDVTDKLVSIHAPARGATVKFGLRCEIIMFQSTRPHGARHALVLYEFHGVRCFNPRARTGRDVSAIAMWFDKNMFQSTRPHGARPVPLTAANIIAMFQSTRPHGARQHR